VLHVQKRLINFLLPYSEHLAISDVRIGLGYTAIKLENGHGGVAWTPNSVPTSCTHFQGAGTLVGRQVKELLSMLDDEMSTLSRALGLATVNALLASVPNPLKLKEEVISSLHISQNDRVAMVGFFGPIIPQLRKTGCQLDILELNDKHSDTLPPEKAGEVLSACTVAIITGTSIINGTFDELNVQLGAPRAAVLLGPSSPLCAEVFKETKITHIAGSRVRDTDGVLRIVSEGGGTMVMKKYLDFETVLVR